MKRRAKVTVEVEINGPGLFDVEQAIKALFEKHVVWLDQTTAGKVDDRYYRYTIKSAPYITALTLVKE